MNVYLLLLIAGLLITSAMLTYFICYGNIKNYMSKIEVSEKIIKDEINLKSTYIDKINNEIVKTTKKDYLEDYKSINKMNINSIEKDDKLNEAEKIINNLKADYEKINKNKDIKKFMSELRKSNEKLTSAKNMFNDNASIYNKLIKKFPYNIISKMINLNFKSYYNIKADGEDTF